MSDRVRRLNVYALWVIAFAAYLFSFLLPFCSRPEIKPSSSTWVVGSRGARNIPQERGQPGELVRGGAAFEILWSDMGLLRPLGFAHPAFWIGSALLLLRFRRGALLVALLGVYLGFDVRTYLTPVEHVRFESAGYEELKITQERYAQWSDVLLGYYLWVGSLVLLAIASYIALRHNGESR